MYTHKIYLKSSQNIIIAICILLILFLSSSCKKNKDSVTFYGGLKGATAFKFSTDTSKLLNQSNLKYSIKTLETGGAKRNIEKVNDDKNSIGIVYAGYIYLAQSGILHSRKTFNNIVALARLYGPTAQLIVHKDSPVTSPYELRGRRVAIGSHGSASAISAQRFFKSLGIWQNIIPIYAGPNRYMEEFLQLGVEALWLLTGVPSRAYFKISYHTPIRILNLFDIAREANHFERFPFYHSAVIPAETYIGQTLNVHSFQDAALLVANKQLNTDFVIHSLESLFSQRGLAIMKNTPPTVEGLSKEQALQGILIPLHDGALKFWAHNANQDDVRLNQNEH